MDTVQQIAFNYSAQRLRVLQTEFELDEDAQVGMKKITNLQSFCEIRWSSRANDLFTFRSAFTDVVTALEYLEEDGNGNVRCYLLN